MIFIEHKLIKRTNSGKIVMDPFDGGMPIGNGRLGAMIPGGTELEVITLNQDSLWSTQLVKRSNP